MKLIIFSIFHNYFINRCKDDNNDKNENQGGLLFINKKATQSDSINKYRYINFIKLIHNFYLIKKIKKYFIK